MSGTLRSSGRAALVWAIVICAIVVPIMAAMASPQLQWRDPIYIAAGFAGIVAMALLLVQPLLMAGLLPGIAAARARFLHRLIGAGLIAAVVVHVAALWITSPPDVVDALLLRSPTRFSVWGVLAMWAVFASGLIAVFRRRFRLRIWRLTHTALFGVTVVGTIVHALRIDGTMEWTSKIVLSILVAAATLVAVAGRKVWVKPKR